MSLVARTQYCFLWHFGQSFTNCRFWLENFSLLGAIMFFWCLLQCRNFALMTNDFLRKIENKRLSSLLSGDKYQWWRRGQTNKYSTGGSYNHDRGAHTLHCMGHGKLHGTYLSDMIFHASGYRLNWFAYTHTIPNHLALSLFLSSSSLEFHIQNGTHHPWCHKSFQTPPKTWQNHPINHWMPFNLFLKSYKVPASPPTLSPSCRKLSLYHIFTVVIFSTLRAIWAGHFDSLPYE